MKNDWLILNGLCKGMVWFYKKIDKYLIVVFNVKKFLMIRRLCFFFLDNWYKSSFFMIRLN